MNSEDHKNLVILILGILLMLTIPMFVILLTANSSRQDKLLTEQLLSKELTSQLADAVLDYETIKDKANSFLGVLLEEPVNIKLLTKYSTEVTVTAYTAREEECNSEPWFTACGELSRPGIIALSRDLETDFGVGMHKRVHVGEFGLYPAKDRMAEYKRKNTNNPVKIVKSVDILFANLEAAKRFTPRKVTLTWFSHKEK